VCLLIPLPMTLYTRRHAPPHPATAACTTPTPNQTAARAWDGMDAPLAVVEWKAVRPSSMHPVDRVAPQARARHQEAPAKKMTPCSRRSLSILTHGKIQSIQSRGASAYCVSTVYWTHYSGISG
jgi:hypothetical protein